MKRCVSGIVAAIPVMCAFLIMAPSTIAAQQGGAPPIPVGADPSVVGGLYAPNASLSKRLSATAPGETVKVWGWYCSSVMAETKQTASLVVGEFVHGMPVPVGAYQGSKSGETLLKELLAKIQRASHEIHPSMYWRIMAGHDPTQLGGPSFNNWSNWEWAFNPAPGQTQTRTAENCYTIEELKQAQDALEKWAAAMQKYVK